jgi:hypothetical protein
LINSNEHIGPITKYEPQDALKQCKNKRVKGSNDINMELIKYVPNPLLERLLEIKNNCW